MSRDRLIALTLYVGALAASVIFMIFLDYFKLQHWAKAVGFWGAIGICVICTTIAFFTAKLPISFEFGKSMGDFQMSYIIFGSVLILIGITFIGYGIGPSASAQTLASPQSEVKKTSESSQETQKVEAKKDISIATHLPKTPPSPKEQSQKIEIKGNNNVTSINQSGGITAGTVINHVIPPSLKIIGHEEIENPDGSRTVIYKTIVDAPFTPGLLKIKIQTAGLKDVSVMPPSVNGVSSINLRNTFKSSDSYSTEIPSPNGQYLISITTTQKSEIQFTHNF